MLRRITLFVAYAMAVLWLTGSAWAADEREWTVDKHLKVAGQPAKIGDIKDADECYRFVKTDAGLTSSDIVLIYLKGNEPLLKAAEVDLHSYYNSNGKEGVELKERKLTREEWHSFKQRFTAADVWNIKKQQALVLDGGHWNFEAKAFGRYRQVSINSPDTGPYRALCLEAWRLSGLFMGNYENLKE